MTIPFFRRCTAAALLCLAALLPLSSVPSASAASGKQAENIAAKATIVKQTGFPERYDLFDGRTYSYLQYPNHSSLTFAWSKGIQGISIYFDPEYDGFSVTDDATGQTVQFGQNHFLREYADLQAAFGYLPTQVTLRFDAGMVRLSEIGVYGPGELPDTVQRWELPADGAADILLFPTHCDDEQLFLGGVVPLYVSRGYTVQVVFMTDHRNGGLPRCAEALDGLWAVGCRNYPVFGTAPDIYTDQIYYARNLYAAAGYPEETLLSFVIENIRRFRPSVAVGHDILNGEYGHGAHMLYAEVLSQAVEVSADPTVEAASAERWGVWDVPKTYLHLYPENPITLDLDQPLEMFGGLSAFEVSVQKGFAAHYSQLADFSWYVAGKHKATDIVLYSPCEYGLFRSTVGSDTGLNDFMENIP